MFSPWVRSPVLRFAGPDARRRGSAPPTLEWLVVLASDETYRPSRRGSRLPIRSAPPRVGTPRDAPRRGGAGAWDRLVSASKDYRLPRCSQDMSANCARKGASAQRSFQREAAVRLAACCPEQRVNGFRERSLATRSEHSGRAAPRRPVGTRSRRAKGAGCIGTGCLECRPRSPTCALEIAPNAAYECPNAWARIRVQLKGQIAGSRWEWSQDTGCRAVVMTGAAR
jgi:hypothetical protein